MGKATPNAPSAESRGVGKTKVVSGGTTVNAKVSPKRVRNGKG